MIPVGRDADRGLFRNSLEFCERLCDRIELRLRFLFLLLGLFASIWRSDIENVVPDIELEVRTRVNRFRAC